MDLIIQEVYQQYDLKGELKSIAPVGNGLINKTFLITQLVDNQEKRYILQCINHSIFQNVEGLMHNIVTVTNYLKEKIKKENGDYKRQVLSVVPTKSGKSYVTASNNTYWRIYPFVEGTYVLNKVENLDQFYETGRSFGHFQSVLKDFDASQLVEVLPKFHDTRFRLQQLLDAVKEDKVGRVKEVQDEINFVLSRKDDCFLLYDLLDKKELPLRVTHNDTKLNNILIDSETNKGICIVDLDTIMPGISLFDFGDSIRYGANDCAEDEADLTKVNFDITLFEAYAKGFLQGSKGILTNKEIELLPWGARIITLEQGIRFLTDYINGDTYYATTRENQNLDRTRTQFKLVLDMEKNWDKLNQIIKDNVA